MRILVVNAGSSSVKLRVLETDDRVAASLDLPATDGRADDAAVKRALAGFGDVDASGHRVVHGGTELTSAVVIDAHVEKQLRALTDLAPLHQPAALAMLDVVRTALPKVPAVACFDTAFHANMPAAAATYALPAEWRRRWPLRRFGFHGLSHAYAARRAAELVGAAPSPERSPAATSAHVASTSDTGTAAADLRVVTCHLGAGASLAAVTGGRSVDTTMGFTPLEGLVMATRSGSVDPGLVLWLAEHARVPPAEITAALEQRSGLRGLAGTADMRAVLAAAETGDADATLALDVYLHRLRAGIAAMAAAMGGLDALVFTGGVGENAPTVRARAANGLAFLGVAVDPERNAGPAAVHGKGATVADREIGVRDALVRTFVVAAREDLEIAREIRGVLAQQS
jgi:acetate kinase